MKELEWDDRVPGILPVEADQELDDEEEGKMTNFVCRVCSVELGIKRENKKWAAIGTCPHCGGHHVLYFVAREQEED